MAELARLEAELRRLEDAHDFDAAPPNGRIEQLIEQIAEISFELDAEEDRQLAAESAPRKAGSTSSTDISTSIPSTDMNGTLHVAGRLQRSNPESAARSERRRVQRAAERRRRAERTRTIRWCECGCGQKIPPEADPRQKFIDETHRYTHRKRNGKGQPTGADTLAESAVRKPHGKAKSEGSKTEFCNLREAA